MRITYGSAALIAMFIAGCATQAPAGRVIHQEGEADKTTVIVRLDSVTDVPPFAHPSTLPPERLAAMLSAIMVQPDRGLISALIDSTPRRAFADDEAALLAGHLSKALADATPQEVAVFYLSAPEAGETARITSGGLYVRDDQLIVMLSNYQYAITWSDQTSSRAQASAVQARERPLVSYPENEYRLVPAKGQALLGGKPSGMERFFKKPSRALVFELAQAPAAQAAEPAKGEPAGAAAPPAAVAPPAEPTIEDKLRRLKKLHEEGLISTEDYEMNKQKLLESF